jgi:uncharacterized membrane protein
VETIARRLGDEQTGTQRGIVSDAERLVSGIGGSALAVYGFKRRDWPGLALALIGGGLLYHSLNGQRALAHALGISPVLSTHGEQYVEVVKSVTINRPVEEVYRFWRNFENLPRFMRHLTSVEVLNEKRSRWTANAPGGMTITWEADIVNEKNNTLIAWQSVEGSDINHRGIVRFASAPQGRGTEVVVELEYEPIAGLLGTAVAKLFGEEPNQQVEDDIRRFKQFMEAGEIPTTDGQARGAVR